MNQNPSKREENLRSPESSDGAPGRVIAALRRLPALDPLFAEIDGAMLSEFESLLTWFGVAAGTVLFQEGEAGHDACILLAGRLGTFVTKESEMELVGQIARGEFVGEMSLISGEPRSATVIALRDSELVRFPQEAFDELLRLSPQASAFLMRELAARLRQTSRSRILSRATESIAIVPLVEPLADVCIGERLAESLSDLGRTVMIRRPGVEIEEAQLRPSQGGPQLVVYIAAGAFNAWTRHAIRQSDRVIFVANAEFNPPVGSNEAVAYATELHRGADLVLINKRDSKLPVGGTAWLSQFPSDRIIHIRRGDSADLARVARLTLRRGIGLVLSGGGVRGFAHVGVIKAFQEANIPIDLVGGTSFGSVVAAMLALDFSPDAIAEALHQSFVRSKPLNDFTIPVIALVRGRKISLLLRKYFGDVRIENLWRNFFCVSANLSKGEAFVHQQGLLRHAVRASGAIPGIAPPVIMDGHVLVDGGIMNNLPVNVMATLLRGPIIAVDVTGGGSFSAQTSEIEDKSLLWLLTKGWQQVPSIFRTLMQCATISDAAQANTNRDAADILIRPELGSIDMLEWPAYAIAMEAGYRAGVETARLVTEKFIAAKSLAASGA
ncbi:MAG: patatin-like phospholipase family protein [Candidatus Acidiferrales bacterium]